MTGLILKQGAGEDSSCQIFVVAKTIEWYPEQPNAGLGVYPDHVTLAKRGMDIGLFEEIRDRDGAPLEARDNACFYHLLAATGQAIESQERSEAADLPLTELLQKPGDFHGKRFQFRAGLRRATKVSVRDPEVLRRWGVDHYFQLDLFLPLGKAGVAMASPNGTPTAATFENRYPATLCLRQLPQGVSEGDRLQMDIWVDANFFRLWSFHSEYVAKIDDTLLQTNPLFIGSWVQLVEHPPTASPVGALVLCCIFALAAISLWYGFARHGPIRRQRRSPDSINSPSESPPSRL